MFSSIRSLTEKFFELQQFDFEREVSLKTQNDKEITLSYVIEGFTDKEKELGGTIGVLLQNNKEMCDLSAILKAEEIGTNIPHLLRMMVIANQFSPTARQLADHLGIVTFSQSELESIKNMYLQPKTAFNA